MTKRIKKTFTEEMRHRCWQLWRQGLGYSDIALAIASKPGTVFGLIRLNGGLSPPQRKRSSRHLSLSEREEISKGIAQGCSIRNIAYKLNRSLSTVSRELTRHGGASDYRATQSDAWAWKNALRPKACKLASKPELYEIITDKLQNK